MINLKFNNSVWLLTVLSVLGAVSIQVHSTDPDVGISFEDLAKSHGFQVDTHLVTTEDGYILTLQRIVNPSLSGQPTNLKPVILQAGLMETGIDFIVNSPFVFSNNDDTESNLGDNLGFDLVLTECYDVWVANSRGVMRTDNQHVTLSTSDPKFWAYGWDEMGMFDLPAVIDYVLQETGRDTLGYVGFSEGTTSLYILLSMKPQYADKIEPAISMAPIAYLDHMVSPIRFLNPFTLGLCYDGQFIVSTELSDKFLASLCPFDVAHIICQNIMFLVAGFDYENLNTTRIPVYVSHFPGPASNRQICHYFQTYESGRFARYDFGSEEKNNAHYQQSTAPDYPLEKIGKITMAFFFGENDFFSRKPDLDHLMERLEKSSATLIPTYVIDEPNWSHPSFVFGIGAGRLVYKDLIDVLDRYTLDR